MHSICTIDFFGRNINTTFAPPNTNTMKDPLQILYEKHGFEKETIANYVIGDKYVAIVQENGHIGLGAVLNNTMPATIPALQPPDFKNVEHRIIITAYFNALLNYNNSYNKEIDIFDELEFGHYKKIVMIGLCRPLFKKMQQANIPVHVFDEGKDDQALIPMHNQEKYLKDADCVILTSTTIINGSFYQLMSHLQDTADAYLFGPSGILSKEMFRYKPIRYIFGSIFDKNDQRVLDLIAQGHGTPVFSKYMHKVFIQNGQV